MTTSTSELLFPAEDGSQRPPDSALHKVLRRALGRAGLVEGDNHVCRRNGCGYAVKKSHAALEPLPPLRHEALAPGAPSPAAPP
ncbi:hypothetical protein [Corallococcus sp. M7]